MPELSQELHCVSAASVLRAFHWHYRTGNTTFVRLRILSALAQGTKTNHDLVQFIYGDDPEGGAQSANTVVNVTITRLRRAGYDIRRCSGHRYEWVRHNGRVQAASTKCEAA